MAMHPSGPRASERGVIASRSRQRRWTLEEKQRIVAESYSVPRNVSATARRNGVAASLLHLWRQRAREGRLSAPIGQPAFVPALVDPAQPHTGKHTGGAASMAGRMEIVLSGHGFRVIVGRDVDAQALRRVIDELERT